MSDFGFEEMQKIQKELQEKYKHKWTPLSPELGTETLLWMMVEAGEMADIIKKQGSETIVSDETVRKHFIEEMCDTLMFLNDVMICYKIDPEELAKVYREKHRKNMERW